MQASAYVLTQSGTNENSSFHLRNFTPTYNPSFPTGTAICSFILQQLLPSLQQNQLCTERTIIVINVCDST